MLTIFTSPKPFRGHIKVIQTNAIQSWTLLRPKCEVILFGSEEGTAEIAAKFKVGHVSQVECNEYGTPLVSSMFKIAQDIASYPLLCYANADIILMSDFMPAVQRVPWQAFLLVGQRWDLDLKEPIDFNNPDWEERMRAHVADAGKLHGRSGIDYFVSPSGLYRDIPPFAIGRPAWDNWMIYKARMLKLPVIDATRVVTAVHQKHDYSHITRVSANSGQAEKKGSEVVRNRQLLGGDYRAFSLLDATYLLTPVGLKPTLTLSVRYLAHRILRLPEMHPHWIPLMQIIKGLRLIIFGAAALRRRMLKRG